MILSISGKINSGKDTVGKIIQVITSSPTFTDEAVLKFLDRELLNQKFEIKKWADAIKDMVCMMLGCTRVQLEDREFKEKELGEEWWYYKVNTDKDGNWMIPYGSSEKVYEDEDITKPTPRLLLQLLGTECGRNILHPNIWVNTLMSEYKEMYAPFEYTKRTDYTKTYWAPDWIITDTRFPNELEAVKDRCGITIRVNRDKKEIDTISNIESYSYAQKELKEKYGIETSDYPNEVSIKDDSNLYNEKGLLPKYTKEFNDLVNSYIRSIRKEHESETALDNHEFDYTIDNNGSLLELIAEVRIILKQLKLC